MSIQGGIDVAVGRGTSAGPRQRRGIVADTHAGDQKAPPAGIGVLVSLIPVEIITLYTAFVATTVTRSTPSATFLAEYLKAHKRPFPYDQVRDLEWVRWSVYAILAASVVGILYFGWKKSKLSTDTRKLPFPEMLAAVAAFAAWGLTMPGGLLTPYIKSDDLAFVTLAIITAVSAALLALGFGTLKSPTKDAASS